MKCRAHTLVRAQKKINKIQSNARWLSKDNRMSLYEQGKDDPDIKDLVAYNQKRQEEALHIQEELKQLKEDTKDIEE